ncbi:spore coat protein [Halalkalibacter hemicellulosilyticus]|uniref:Inner spore coat protein D n=1 Tax=Halalkalibacter hemicellulosilyticusJCM 9152 TaxID=1236971 RepID=W4QJF6_9BACI|nr:spore coat protein [Halalkalibacter hemicellulosilyticus]GAE32231.1 inner spore coat protein D [Halalkalibacter hemicellulosilyticusJCM 9152]
MFCPPPRKHHARVLPAIVHPTQHDVIPHTQEYIVPEIHPRHTTVLNRQVFNHVHSFPHTVSQQQQVISRQFYQPPGPPTPVAGAMAGPGFGAPGYGGPGYGRSVGGWL